MLDLKIEYEDVAREMFAPLVSIYDSRREAVYSCNNF